MYKLLPPNEFGNTTTVKHVEANKFIPFDPANTDYQAYLLWLAEGNEPADAWRSSSRASSSHLCALELVIWSYASVVFKMD